MGDQVICRFVVLPIGENGSTFLYKTAVVMLLNFYENAHTTNRLLDQTP